MKINEIIVEHEFPQAKTRYVKNTPDIYDYEGPDAFWSDEDEQPIGGNPHPDNPDIETLGSGCYATAYRHKKNPYDVVKGSKASTEKEGFDAFYDALSRDKEAQSNPYFPRFRNMRKYKGQDGRQSYIARVEPLEKYQQLSKHEREMLANKIFSDHGIDVIEHYFVEARMKNFHPDPRTEYFPGQMFAWGIQQAIENNTWADELRWEIKDKMFKKAIEFLQKAAKEQNFLLDMHHNNMMVRRTSVGPQLVFNDPFSMPSNSEASNED